MMVLMGMGKGKYTVAGGQRPVKRENGEGEKEISPRRTQRARRRGRRDFTAEITEEPPAFAASTAASAGRHW
jgi:hypothetical protein